MSNAAGIMYPMTMNLTLKRKIRFCQDNLAEVSTPIGFADVGSGGELKFPWNILPIEKLHKFNFDPEELRESSGGLPVCVSNHRGESVFYIAQDPRASSLHPASMDFIKRFDQEGLLPKQETRVTCETLDHIFDGRYREVDLLDINVEGHDFQVLQGSARLFLEGFIKCVKIEFELTEVWKGQGWFGDIDSVLRGRGYELGSMDVECSRPANVLSIYHPGEPLWGKAIYVSGRGVWESRYDSLSPDIFKEAALKAIVLFTILDFPGRALDLLDFIHARQLVSMAGKVKLSGDIIAVFKHAKLDARLQKVLGWIPFLRRSIG